MRLLIALCLFGSSVFCQSKVEILNFRTARLNGSIPSVLAIKDLVKKLGKPTKIENINPECALTEDQEKAKVFKNYYFGKTKFFTWDGNAELQEIDFRTGKFSYKTSKINLNAATTLNDVEKIYPIAVRAAKSESNGTLVRLRPCGECDGYCFLFFEKGKLVKLQWYEDC